MLTENSYNWCGTVPTIAALEKARPIALLLMDVDGVMTDAKTYYLPGPDDTIFETKAFDAYDGLGFHLLNAAGIATGAISGRASRALEERGRSLKFSYLYQCSLIKEPIFEEILEKSGLEAGQIAYVGDDLTDLPLMRRAGLACAVANARQEVKAAAHFITVARGGQGAVREVVELILKAQGKWQDALQHYQITI